MSHPSVGHQSHVDSSTPSVFVNTTLALRHCCSRPCMTQRWFFTSSVIGIGALMFSHGIFFLLFELRFFFRPEARRLSRPSDNLSFEEARTPTRTASVERCAHACPVATSTVDAQLGTSTTAGVSHLPGGARNLEPAQASANVVDAGRDVVSMGDRASATNSLVIEDVSTIRRRNV